MKRFLSLALLMLAIAVTASAQKWNSNSEHMFQNLIKYKMKPVGQSYAISTTPIVYMDYYNIIYGKLSLRQGEQPQDVVPDNEFTRNNLINTLNKHVGRNIFKRATQQQIIEAHKKVGLHGEVSQTAQMTKGFFVTLPYNEWKKLTSSKIVTVDDNSKLKGTSNKEGDIFNIH